MNGLFPKNILIVEDEWAVRGGTRSLLQTLDPTVRIAEAESFAKATQILGESQIDLAFLDFDLRSEKNGFDVLDFIKEHELSVTSIVMSGRSDSQFIHDCLRQGAAGYIPKAGADEFAQLTAEEVLRRAIETVLKGSVYLPASYLGKGGYSPSGIRAPDISAEAMGLTRRQTEVLYYLVQGMTNKGIARVMNIAEGTVRKDYVTSLLRHFGVSRRTELLRKISERQIVIPRPMSSC